MRLSLCSKQRRKGKRRQWSDKREREHDNELEKEEGKKGRKGGDDSVPQDGPQ